LSNRLLETIAGALAVVAFLAGCGGSGDPPPLTKAEFIKQGDEICANAEAELEEGIGIYTHEEEFNEVTGPTKKQELGLVVDVILPRFQILAEELGELGPPEGEEAKIEEIIVGLEEAVADGEADPRSVLTGANPFEAVREDAAEFGLRVCGET
jgi:hypothetical protein